MADRFAILKVYSTEIEAEVSRAKLESSGIEAFVSKDDAGGMRPHLQLSLGVRLLVPRENLSLAEEILDHENAEEVLEPWHCPGCGESVEGQFTECWQCGASKSGG